MLYGAASIKFLTPICTHARTNFEITTQPMGTSISGRTAIFILLGVYILSRASPKLQLTAFLIIVFRSTCRKLISLALELASTRELSTVDQKLLQQLRSSKMPHGAADMERSSSPSSTSSTSTSPTPSTGETPHGGTPSPPCLTPPATPPATPPPEDNETYLAFNDAIITNNQFHYIMHTSGQEAFMQDDCLDMASKILAHNEKCADSHISIASTFEAQIFYGAANDPNGGYEEYSKQFGDAKWIFIPINDGMAGKVNASIQGSHWSLLVLNRVSKTAHYFDSLFIDQSEYHELASAVFCGTANVLGENVHEWVTKVEYNSPNQKQHNICKEEAYTSCGPFVYSMTEFLIFTIQEAQRKGCENQHVLDLRPEFPRLWAEMWDSRAKRQEMQNSVADMKMAMETAEETDGSDEVVELELEDVEPPTLDEAVEMVIQDVLIVLVKEAQEP